MRFISIISNKFNFIHFVKINSKNYFLLEKIVNINLKRNTDTLINVTFDKVEIENLLNLLFMEREKKPLDIPEYDKKFWKEEDIFEEKDYGGKHYKLCKTGFDNQILFLIDIFDGLNNKESYPCYLFFSNNLSEFNRWKIINFNDRENK